MCIDIDHKSDSEIEYLKNILSNLPWIIAYFRSPSGDGLKVLVKTTVSNTTDYEKCYCQLIDYFLSELGCKVDESCKEYSKACYASFDPDIYVAQDIEDFPYNPKYDSLNVSTVTVADTDNHSECLIPRKADTFMNTLQSQVQGLSDEQILKILDRKFSRYPDNYKDGHRTKSIFVQATKLCKAGIEYSLALDYLKGKFIPTGYNIIKLEYEVRNAYVKGRQYFGSERGQYKAYQDYKNMTKSNRIKGGN